MRDPKRLDKFYDELKRIHQQYYPDWRFGQLFYNFGIWLIGEKEIDIFFPEEDRMIELFKEFTGEKDDG